MSTSVPLAICSALLILTSVGVTIKQHNAKSCQRHQYFAGLVAQLLAVLCLTVGVTLAGLVFLFRE